MRRIMLKLAVALAAFCVGVGCEFAFQRYLEATSPAVIESIPLELELTDGSLPVVLQRIDDKYRRRCQLHTDLDSDWPAIRQLVRFRACSDEWATARRKAIDAELQTYMVQY